MCLRALQAVYPLLILPSAAQTPRSPCAQQGITRKDRRRFQTLLFFALFSILSIRERRAFWRSPPSTVLAAAIAAGACLGVFVGVHGLAELRPLPLGQTAVVIGYAMVCFLVVNDWVKTILIARAARVVDSRAE